VADAAAIERGLAAYLGAPLAHFGTLASGWETTIFEFAIAARSARIPDLVPGTKLVLRRYEGREGDAKGTRESHTMRILAAAGYPAPRPHLYEPDHTPLAGPFLVMNRVAGGPLFSTRTFSSAFKNFSLGFVGFVRAQVRLHRLASKYPNLERLAHAYQSARSAPDAPLLDRLLDVIADRVEQGPLPGLRDALAILRMKAARFRATPAAIVHMDYHPQNVIVAGLRVNGVIDWVRADRGDRHLCAATTAVILATSAMDQPWWIRDNAAGKALRALFTALYLPLYHALAPMELARFRYCQAVAALQRLSMFGIMRVRGPEAAGFRPEAIANITPGVVRLLSRYAGRKAGVLVSIPDGTR
jgi:aminoglycoside phosphotransferase (APT) family kinase protein